MAQLVKNLPANVEDLGSLPGFNSRGWEDALEKGRATHSNILAWTVTKSQTQLSNFHFTNLLYLKVIITIINVSCTGSSMMCRLSCPMTCGILVPQALHWKVDYLSLDHVGSPLLKVLWSSSWRVGHGGNLGEIWGGCVGGRRQAFCSHICCLNKSEQAAAAPVPPDLPLHLPSAF